MIRNIIFDWSGTLVDDLPAVWHASNHVFRLAGVPELTLDEFRRDFCLPFQRFYDRYVPHIALPQLEDWFHARFREVQQSVEELPHAREFLEFCRARGLRTFLLSTVHEEHFATQTAHNGFAQFLDRPYVGIWDKREKILELLSENGLDAPETLFVGDMEHDIETAHHGGVFACGVLTGYNTVSQLRAARPDLIVEHLGELREVLDRCQLDLEVAIQAPLRPIATVGALIFDDLGQVLMVRTRKWSNLWGIPGGKIKGGEAAADALRREIREETGLAIDAIQFVMAQDCIRSEEFYREAHFLLLNYTCRVAGPPEVSLNDEAQEFRWVPPADALRLPLNSPTRLLLERVLATRTDHRHG